jgi:hypothetical protein
MMDDVDERADWDAAYVLGALSRDDRHLYETYLAENPDRAAALTELAGLPGILNMLTCDEAIALTEQAGDSKADVLALDLVPSLAFAAARRQRRSRRSMLVAGFAMAAAIAIGAGAVGATAFPHQEKAEGIALQAMQPTLKGGINAALAVTEKKWGTRLDWTCEYVKDWAKAAPAYDIVVTTVEGAESAVGTWSPASDHASGLAASTAIPTARIRTVDIRVSGTHEPLAVTTMR